jgi:hypothetical protein
LNGKKILSNDSKIEGEFRTGLLAECAEPTTLYENKIAKKEERKYASEMILYN